LNRDSKNFEEYWETSLRNLRKARARFAGHYNAVRRQAEFRVGDLVPLSLHPLSSRSHQRSAKLDWKWSSPPKIGKFMSPVTILLANPDTGVIISKAHISQVKRAFQSGIDILQ
jgi:hypothetical protein